MVPWRVSSPPVSADLAGCCRRTLRHTTHLKDLPEHVMITRTHHPFEGKKLPIFGVRRFQGKLHLMLILPNGSRSLIPTEWTDLGASQHTAPASANLNPRLGSVGDLLHARAVVDALLHSRTSSHSSDAKSVGEENHSVATPSELSGHPHSRDPDMGKPGKRAKNTGNRTSVADDRASYPCQSENGARA